MILRWFVYHFLTTLGFYLFLRVLIPVDDNKPLVFLGFFGGVFFLIWLFIYFIQRSYFFKLPKIFRFIGFILKELIISNLRVAYDVLSPYPKMNPAIVAIPLDATTDFEIVALATFITLTPGTLALKVSDDRKTLFIHEMYIRENNVEALRQKIKNDLEKRIMELSKN
jgi:multicomponent Na+:H+ antiporter subunit E